MTWNEIYTCPICNYDKCCPPHGPEDSPVLVIGEFPGADEEIRGIPFIGRTGTILKQQLRYLRWDLSHFRVMNLWQHQPNKNDECLKHGKERCISEAEGKKVILLIGSDATKTFTDQNVSDVCGIPVESPYFSADVVMALYNPAIVFHSVLGEVKLGLEKFCNIVERYYE